MPLRKRVTLLCVVALLVTTAALHREVLFRGLVYHMDDAADGYYPSHVANVHALLHGELPAWEPSAWAGLPLLADPYYGFFYPLSFAFVIFGAVHGLGVLVGVHTFLAGLGMFVLLRRRGLSHVPALFGALSFMLSGFFIDRIRHLPFLEGAALMPWVLAGIEGYLQTRRARELALIAIALAGTMLAGALPLLLFFLLVIGAYTLPRVIAQPRAAIWLALAGLIGFAIAAAQLVPTLLHMRYSPRSLGTDYLFASSYAWPDLRYAITLFVPDMFGTGDKATWHGVFNHWEMAGYYSGLSAMVLVVFAFRRGARELWALLVLGVCGVWLATGDHSALHRVLYRFLPLYGALRCPVRALVMNVIVTPILAAEGLQQLMSSAQSRKWALVLAPFVVGCLAITYGLAHHARFAAGLLPWQLAPTRGAAGIATATLAGIVAIVATRGRARFIGAAVIVIALGCDMFTIDRGYLQPQPHDFAVGTERFAAVNWLFAQHPHDRFAVAANGPFRLLNVGLTYDVPSANGYDSVGIWRYVNFLWVLNHGTPYPFAQLRDDLAAGQIRRWDSPLVNLLNIRWVIAPDPPTPAWRRVFAPDAKAPLAAAYEPSWDRRLNVYENPNVLPRAFVVYTTQVIAEPRAQAAALARLDPTREAIVDRAPSPMTVNDHRAWTAATITRSTHRDVNVTATALANGLLVLADAYYPEWTATVDGRPAPILAADYALRGVTLASGAHEVTFHFTPWSVYAGILGSLFGVFALLVLVRRNRQSVVL